MSKYSLLRVGLIGISALAFSGCAIFGVPFLLGATGVGVATKVAIDKRSVGAQVDDNAIDSQLGRSLDEKIPDTHINVTTFNRVVLLTGEVPNAGLRQQAEEIAKAHLNVRGVFNYLTIGPNAGLGARSGDTVTTTKVKTALISNDRVKARDIKVITESSVVYMFGIVSAEEAEIARQLASDTAGVTKVVTLFEIPGNP